MRKSQLGPSGGSSPPQRFILSKKLGSEIKAVEKQTHLPVILPVLLPKDMIMRPARHISCGRIQD